MPENPEFYKQIRRKKRNKRILFVGLLLLLLAPVVDYYAFPYGRPIAARGYNRGKNGLWLRYTWYFGQHSDHDIHLLAQELKDRQIHYAYFHVRNIGNDGRLRYHYQSKAQHLLGLLHQDAPSVQRIAWIYVGNPRAGGDVDVANMKHRKAMVQQAVWLVTECGFDGVQWDYESCDDRDAILLNLIEETRAALPPGKLLSVATSLWAPDALQYLGWSEDYFTQIAARCDQIVVMGYDSGFFLPRSYVWLMRQQAIHVTRAVARGDLKCRVLIGVPTYGPGLRSHGVRAENLRFALRGVREGLEDPDADASKFSGVALFADYTTDEKDWRTYNDLWLKPSTNPSHAPARAEEETQPSPSTL